MEASLNAQARAGLLPDPRSHNLLVGRNVAIDPTAEIGANVIILDDVEIGPGASIGHNVILGRPPHATPNGKTLPQAARLTRIAAGVTISDGAHILRGAVIGERTFIGDNTFVREGARLGSHCMIGEGCGVGSGAQVGDRVRLQAKSTISPLSVVEDDVFISAFVAAITDNSSGRDPNQSNGRVTLRRGCRIGANVSMLPGVEIGEEAVVGAGAVVRESVPARTKVAGVPARKIGIVGDDELLEG